MNELDGEMKAVLKRISDLEGEVNLLKQQLAEMKTPPSHKIEQVKKVHLASKIDQPMERQIPTRDEVPSQQKVRKEFDLERVLSTWLPRVFMFILLLGVLWGLKVGMDNGIISNPVRVGMGYAGTILLYFLGMRFYNSGKKGFGLTLLGGFIGLGILTTFAAHLLYGYLNFTIAFIIGVAYILAGLLLSRKTKSETLTIFSGIAGFLLPFLLEGEGATSVQFCSYILLLFLSLFYVSLSQKHKYTFYVTFLLFHLTLFLYALLDSAFAEESILVATVLIQHIVLLFFYLKGSISRDVFSEVLLYSNFIFTIVWIKLLGYTQEITVYGLLALVYIALAAYSYWKKESALRGVLSAVAVFAACVFILSFDMEDNRVFLILLLLNGTIGIRVGIRYDTFRTIVTGSVIYVFTVQAVLNTIQINAFWSLEHAVWLVFIGSFSWIFYTLYRFTPSRLIGKTKSIDKSLIVGQLLILFYILKLTKLWLANTYVSFETGIHVQALVFLVVLSAMYFCHRWSKGLYLTHAAVILLLIAGIGILLLGMGSYYKHGEFLFNFFVQLAFVAALTAVVWAIAKDRFYLSRKELKWETPQLAIVLQITYFIVLNKWYLAFAKAYEWDLEYVLFAHTFLLFAFAFVSISIGGKMNWKYVKIIGAVLIIICVLKLFIVDLSSISILVRAILFTIVGVVGLVYSRTLLKED
ncbi:DUF2339 domain-containing protein [Sporosarcina sp. ANT_H38]|uniref:DUF2339 domain-containing protein n=1 Tax=Sporosarcina sp. ANT_H38 TaxID=2597358 RepID=UPI0011F2CFA6|nr:DUF2339 domain-containing protein [Sporosarcina sp. ANT_H38]KAA0948545.1 DUF2339 domain-containing protein [Sporosarcina sp. ANT_H38]